MPVPSRDKVDLLWWTSQFLKDEKGRKYEFSQRPYLKEIYDCWAKHQVLKKAAQLGLTTFAVNKALWLSNAYNVTTIFTMPTGKDINEFSKTRFNPALRNSNISQKLEIDNAGVKQIGNSFIYFRGAWNEKQAISIPSDFNIHDELDRSKPDIREMYEERLSASEIGWKLDISTPTIPNYGISSIFEETDKRMWFVKCKCGFEQMLSEENIIDNEYRCLKCKEILDRARACWKPTAKSDIVGYKLSQLMALWIPAKEILRKKAKYRFKADYYNMVLGDEYAGGEGMATRGDVIACLVKPYQAVGKTVIGVDWGDTSWFVVKRGKSLIYFGAIVGDTRTHSKQVAALMEKFDAHAVCDFGYGDTKNNDLIEWFPGRVWMCIYTEDGRDMNPRLNEEKRVVNIDRTRSLQESLKDIQERSVEIFEGEEVETLINHVLNVAETKEEDKHGQIKTIIKKTGDDHLLHAFNYTRLLEGKDISEDDISTGGVDRDTAVSGVDRASVTDFEMG